MITNYQATQLMERVLKKLSPYVSTLYPHPIETPTVETIQITYTPITQTSLFGEETYIEEPLDHFLEQYPTTKYANTIKIQLPTISIVLTKKIST